MKTEAAAGGSNHLPPILITVPEACRLLGLSRSTVWSLIGSGRITAARIGRRTLPHYKSIEALAEISEGHFKAPQAAASVERLK
jgi:excisionase family DNA binding protein